MLHAAPPSSSGLALHFDASDIDAQKNTSLLDGEAITVWKDLSGNQLDLDMPTGTPTYIQPGPGFGGLPVVQFNPVDFNGADYLSRAAAPIHDYPFTVFAVVRSATTRNAVIFSLVDAQSREKMAGIRFVYEGNGEPGRISLFRRNPVWVEAPSSEAFNDNAFHIVTARFVNPSLARLYVDGQLRATSETHIALPTFNRFDLGNNGRNQSTTDPYEGQIAELMVYDEDLDGSERREAEAYLSEKWITGRAGIATTHNAVDFGSVALSEPQSREITITHSGAEDGSITIESLDLGSLGDFSLRAYLNEEELEPADPTAYPFTLSRASGDELRLVATITPTAGELDYHGSLRILSNAENQPDLAIPLTARLRNRVGVTDYENHRSEGNRIHFDLQGNAEVCLTLNTAAMARIQYAPDGEFRSDDSPDYFMVRKFAWDPVTYSIQDHGSYLGIHTSAMTVRVQKSPFRIQLYDPSNTILIVKDSDEEGMYAEQGQRGVVRVENDGEHARFGFGSGDHGHSRPLDKRAGYDQFTVTHGRTCVPFFMSMAGYGVFLNTVEKDTAFDDSGGFRTTGFLDYWFMVGDFKKVLGLYSELTGRMNLFPKWGYGFMLSKYGNDNATQAEFLEWIHRLRDEGYPTDSYVFDYGWRGAKFDPHRWNAQRYPDISAMFAEARQLGFHIGLHNNKGTPEAGNGNFADPGVAENWWRAHWDNVIEPGHGDWFWPDEFDVAGDNLMANRAAKIVHERWLEATTDQRPMFLTRGGFANHHFSSTWSGDIPNTIAEMSEQITGALALGMSGYPWSSNDLGGFFAKPSDELYIRWVAQFGAFSGLMRAHGHDGREPWLYGERAQENLRRYLKIRYRLFPYIYTTAWQGARHGIPMMRAMAIEHPADPEAWTKDSQYYFGDWLLVAPALSTQDTQVSVWLPEGTWYDFFDPSVSHEGGRTITVSATLDQIPVFVKAGAIIPSGPDVSHADAKPLNPLTLDLYPGVHATSYRLYEDDGITRAHLLQDAYSFTNFTAHRPQKNTLRFTKGTTENGNPAVFSPALPRGTVIRAHQWSEEPRMVLIGSNLVPRSESLTSLENQNSGWFWTRESEQLIIRFTDDGFEHRIVASATLLDSDGDGLNDLREAEIGTDVYQADTDGDGQSDLMEVSFGISPVDSSSRVSVSGSVISDDPSQFQVTWPSAPGTLYLVEKWQEVARAWQTIAELLATTSTSHFSWPMTESKVILRIRSDATHQE